MGQLALGLRNVAIRFAVFFVMAALLAWALGGTLWPRAESADLPAVRLGDESWFWRVSVGGKQRGTLRWQLMVGDGLADPRPVDERHWRSVAGPVVDEDTVWYGGRTADEGGAATWRVESRRADGNHGIHPVPDALAVEQQLARIAHGLPVQDLATIRRQRDLVLDPSADLVDG